MFYPYPHDVPSREIVALVVDALRNREVDMKEAAHAAWHVAGYGLSKWDIHDVVVAGDVDVASVLESSFLGPMEGPAEEKALPWGIIIPILFEIIRRYIIK